MKKILKGIAVLLSVILLLGACQKDSLNGQLRYSFNSTNLSASLSTTAASSGLAVTAGTNGSVTWTSGTLNVAKIAFGAKRDQSAFSVEYTSLSNVDILNTGTVAGSVDLADGTYSDIALRLKLIESSTAMPLVLKGTYTEVSGTQIPVEIRFNETYELNLSPSQLVIQGDQYSANITLELNNLIKNMVANDFGQTTRTAPNNTILVTSTLNPALYAKLKANLALVPKVQITRQLQI